ncbi:MAG: POTRA domain-containing protein [Candidatus Omnitrophica bacterium]|nr:POTRA domain-containing protein [Candidatus Omnitrophota bacterium]
MSKTKKILLFITILFSVSLLSFAKDSPVVISSVDVSGNTMTSREQVLSKILTSPHQPYNESMVNDDITRLYACGYFSGVSVNYEKKADNTIKILFMVEERSGPDALRRPAKTEKAPVLVVGTDASTQKRGITDAEILAKLNKNTDDVDIQVESVLRNGLRGLLQSPGFNYRMNEEVFLYLRLSPADAETAVLVNTIGDVSIEVVKEGFDEKMNGKYSFPQALSEKRPLAYGQYILPVGRITDYPAIIMFFTLKDFGIKLNDPGMYTIKLTYSNEIGDYGCWVGKLTANPITIEVSEGPA